MITIKFGNIYRIPEQPKKRMTSKEQLKAIPGKRSDLISRWQMEVQLIQNGIWGKKRKAVRVRKLILQRIIMPHRSNFTISISNSNQSSSLNHTSSWNSFLATPE